MYAQQNTRLWPLLSDIQRHTYIKKKLKKSEIACFFFPVLDEKDDVGGLGEETVDGVSSRDV